MQICISPILVEVLDPHFAVGYSCRSVLVFLGSRFAVTILLSFNFLGIFCFVRLHCSYLPFCCTAKLCASCQVTLTSSFVYRVNLFHSFYRLISFIAYHLIWFWVLTAQA